MEVWRDDSVAEGTRFSCRGPMFSSQDLHISLKPPSILVPGIQYPFWTPQAPAPIRTYPQRDTHNTQLKIKFIFFFSNSQFCWYFLYFHFSIWLVSVLCFSCLPLSPSSLSSLSSPGSSFFLFSKHWWWRSGRVFFFFFWADVSHYKSLISAVSHRFWYFHSAAGILFKYLFIFISHMSIVPACM